VFERQKHSLKGVSKFDREKDTQEIANNPSDKNSCVMPDSDHLFFHVVTLHINIFVTSVKKFLNSSQIEYPRHAIEI